MKRLYPLPVAGTIGEQALATGTALVVTDAENDKRLPEAVRTAMRARGVRSNIVMPMMSKGAAIGAIVVNRREAGGFTPHEVELMAAFADQAVIAIENVRLFNETREALERQTAISDILRIISDSPGDVRPVLDAVAARAAQICQAEVVDIVLRDDQAIRVAATFGPLGRPIGEVIPLDRETVMGRSIVDAAPVQVADLQNAPKEFAAGRALARKYGHRTILAVPLVREGRALGTILVRRTEVRPFEEKHVALLGTFADQAAIAIENARLFNETKEALQRQTATAEILRVISRSPDDVQPVLEAVASSAARLCEAQDVVVLLREGEDLRYRVHHGAITPAVSLGETKRISRDWGAGRCAADGRQLHIHDILALTDEFPEGSRMGGRAGYRTVLMTPLLRDGVVLGVIGMRRAEVRPFEPRQIELINTFADQAVIAIENVRLFNETKEALERQKASGEVLSAISSSIADTKPVFEKIAESCQRLFGSDLTGVTIVEGGERIALAAYHGPNGAALHDVYPLPLSHASGTGSAILDAEVKHFPDVEARGVPPGVVTGCRTVGMKAIVFAPLISSGRGIGAIWVGKAVAGAFPARDIALLKTFADQAVIAVQNARLFGELEEKSRQLEEASRHKSNFLASMSHELRTPLNAILGFNEMILGQVYGEVPADMQEPLNDIQASGKHLLRLINNVLDLAKIEAGRMELSLQDYSVQDTVGSVHATLRPLAAEKGLEFLASVPNDLPLAYGDGGRIAQCLMNLAGNSLKFTKAGKVEISAELKGEQLVCKVSDTGIGIPPDKIGSLFTEFKQTDATIASEYGGTGLGLSISRQFIEMHGGRIWAESELGKGSAFIFEIPLRVSAS